ncbi:hypothetical protein [Arsukibacterium sp.]|uniref:hypothetical protein n=1 Tax=Arsukibacterium sp. TaxID=1977258 RepID=UPI00299EC07E|nr:hypothetical protein [Arsukibacterium sp.]MDX1676566.1 hypothetical protein [Arsukibacterium sp.]
MVVNFTGQDSEQVMLVNTVTVNPVSTNNADNPGSEQVRLSSSILADGKARQQNSSVLAISSLADTTVTAAGQTTERNAESVRVSSSIGRVASAGQLTREQALEIYRNIARFL